MNLAVLDYNVSFFRVRNVFQEGYNDPYLNSDVLGVQNLCKDLNPDVICFQEFFNDQNSQIYNSITRFGELGYQYYLMSSPRHDNGLNRGLITFSRFPIVKAGIIVQSENRYNGAIYTDLKIKEDTIRLINVHLNSMELHLSRRGNRNILSYFYDTYTNTNRIKQNQLNTISAFIDNSDIPIIVVGDFNDNQYSYTYKQLASRFANGQKESGNGLGLTYYSKIPLLAFRIDHLFYSHSIRSMEFKTLSNFDYSEHKPIWAKLSVN
ncbi:endonuclease/exonuclease/phosphatase family protein [Reichenbachiella ulvae]|uniref:Endonuclease/exonuclease/phosphatase family protein n=1 Tax=Reichenbachiella ulvae TaxID=2980104 RepID=A0ABT3CNJ5_9BACT|nr:endonuclease/exonuclease/phosphatase family protein [Reichenbachiella ulvae]MCV9385020.1 endonuclease/exonuclease/phosphatase family protein [Reichenbachiella ulvae]